MAKPKMHADYIKVVKQAQKKHPFSILPAQIPEKNGTYAYPLRRTTVGTTVKLYQPILEALRMYTRTENTPLDIPYIMVSRPTLNSSGKVGYTYYLETVDEDGETLLICAGESRVRMTKVDGNDPSIHSPLLPFGNQTGVQITAVTLALIPRILEIDEAKGSGKLSAVVEELGSELEDAENWTTENDIPELTKEHLYYTDAAMLVLNDMELDFGDPISSAPEEFDIEPFVGGVVCENLVNGWTPRFITGNGKAAKKVPKNVTIAMARQQYSGFMAHRKWTPMEKMLIPSFPADMPVMPEVLRMAERICRCKKDTNPVLNGMWRAPTSYGKSTGTRQLACILGMPFLDITCHTNMELQDFKSSFVPVSENGIELDMASVTMPKGEEDTTEGRPPFFDDAITYVSAMDEQQRNALFDPRTFYSAVMVEDTEVLAETIIGSKKEISAEDLCWLYGEVRTAVMREEPLRKQVKQLKATAEVSPKEDNGNQPRFVHVVSNYIKAMVNGYLCGATRS